MVPGLAMVVWAMVGAVVGAGGPRRCCPKGRAVGLASGLCEPREAGAGAWLAAGPPLVVDGDTGNPTNFTFEVAPPSSSRVKCPVSPGRPGVGARVPGHGPGDRDAGLGAPAGGDRPPAPAPLRVRGRVLP
jgi:hypothetical protein